MAHDTGSEKKHAHELIDQLDPAQVSAVVPLLQFMLLDPVSRSLAAAPVEQEPVSPEEAASLDEARADAGVCSVRQAAKRRQRVAEGASPGARTYFFSSPFFSSRREREYKQGCLTGSGSWATLYRPSGPANHAHSPCPRLGAIAHLGPGCRSVLRASIPRKGLDFSIITC